MLGESTIGTLRAAASTRAFASGVKPVEPITSATPRAAHASAWRAEASWLVKSMTTSAPAERLREVVLHDDPDRAEAGERARVLARRGAGALDRAARARIPSAAHTRGRSASPSGRRRRSRRP